MSFEHAPVSKGLMITLGLTSIFVSVFDVKQYFHLQLVPHISRHYQYWRIGVHHVAFASSSDLFIAELLLFSVAVQIERQFGSLKFASFTLLCTILSSLLEFTSLILFHRAGLNYIPPGPIALLFCIIYQYTRIVPSSYTFRVFGLPLTDKTFTYLFALQLAASHLPGSAASAAIGILAGQLYRSDLANLKSYRIPPWIAGPASKYLLPLVGSLRPVRRSNRALPDDPGSAQPQNDEVITTARQPGASTPSQRRAGGASEGAPASAAGGGSGGSVVREWVEGLTGGGAQARGLRIPTDAEITQLTTMFPDIQRDVLVGTLQRSPNIESAVETLLSSQTMGQS